VCKWISGFALNLYFLERKDEAEQKRSNPQINSIDLNIVFKAVLCYSYLLKLMKAFVKKIYRLDSFT